MEAKTKWNLSVFESAAKGLDELVKREHRGAKALTCTAAVLMFLTAPASERQRFIDIVKLAEGRGRDGTVLVAALAELGRDTGKPPPPSKGAADRARKRRPQRRRKPRKDQSA